MKKTANGSLKTNSVFPDLDTPVTIVTKGSNKNKINTDIPVNEKIRPKRNGNGAATNLHQSDSLPIHDLVHVLDQVRNGNFSIRMPVNGIGINGKICDTLNEIISLNEMLVHELNRARITIGNQGRLNHR